MNHPRLTASQIDEYLEKAEVRVFVSVDLAGSTAFKTRNSDWIETFESFYTQFPISLSNAYEEKLPVELPKPEFRCDNKLQVVKFIGDEILFCAVLERHEHVLSHAFALRHAVKTFNKTLQQSPLTKGLATKGTIWLAGFPILNKYVELPAQDSTVTDYIGPFIDAGFRLARLAEPRKIILSIDVALMIAHAMESHKLSDLNFRLFFDGRKVLHGIHRGIPYPIVWLDILNVDSAEEKLLGPSRYTPAPHQIKEFIVDFMLDHQLPFLFLKSDPDKLFSPFEGGQNKRPKAAVVSLAKKYFERRAPGLPELF